jgi:hypothetical protein
MVFPVLLLFFQPSDSTVRALTYSVARCRVEMSMKIAGKFAADSDADSQAMRFPISQIYFLRECVLFLTSIYAQRTYIA